jgi:hypothetical protein
MQRHGQMGGTLEDQLSLAAVHFERGQVQVGVGWGGAMEGGRGRAVTGCTWVSQARVLHDGGLLDQILASAELIGDHSKIGIRAEPAARAAGMSLRVWPMLLP